MGRLFNLRQILQFTNIIRKNKYGISGKNIFWKCMSTSPINNLQLPCSTPIERYMKELQNEYEKLKICNNDLKANERLSEITPLMEIVNKRSKILDNINNLEDLLKDEDKDLIKLAEEEKAVFKVEIEKLDREFENCLLSLNSKNDMCNSIVLEVSAGVGGQEAMLFARELFDMYCNFAELKGWDCYVAELDKSEIGGVRHASAFIEGTNVYQYFKLEAGVHRVQRIPATEKAGRIHTSTVSVNALPQPSDLEVSIKDKDLKIETKRASGAGGQHVNTTDSAVRIVHLPTGIAVECQTDRSQIKNRQTALQRLKAKLYQLQLDAQIAETEATRKAQVNSNYRNEKIRTYNFSQDRITDHRLHSSNFHNLKVFLNGGEQLETLITKLIQLDREKQLNDIFNSLKLVN